MRLHSSIDRWIVPNVLPRHYCDCSRLRFSSQWCSASDYATWAQHDLRVHSSLVLENCETGMVSESQVSPDGMPSPAAPTAEREAMRRAMCHRRQDKWWSRCDQLSHHGHLYKKHESKSLINANSQSQCWVSVMTHYCTVYMIFKIKRTDTHLNVTSLSLKLINFLSSSRSGSSRTADSTHTTICFSSMSHSTSCTNGDSTVESRTFLITRTARGGLYQVSRWLAGSWICITIAEFFIMRPQGPNCWNGDGALSDRVRLGGGKSEEEIDFINWKNLKFKLWFGLETKVSKHARKTTIGSENNNLGLLTGTLSEDDCDASAYEDCDCEITL